VTERQVDVLTPEGRSEGRPASPRPRTYSETWPVACPGPADSASKATRQVHERHDAGAQERLDASEEDDEEDQQVGQALHALGEGEDDEKAM